jgi:hypothetical protein
MLFHTTSETKRKKEREKEREREKESKTDSRKKGFSINNRLLFKPTHIWLYVISV